MRELGKYAVGIYPAHYKELSAAGALHEIRIMLRYLQTKVCTAEILVFLTLEEGKDVYIM